MESYKIRPDDNKQIPIFLLPISFGISSTALLYFINAQLQGQRQKVTRTRYKLKILHVDETVLDPSSPPAEHLAKIQERFPEAGDYISAKLEDIYNFPDGTQIEGLGEGGDFNAESMRAKLLALPSPTSREDMAGIIRTRLIVAIAKREGCGGILWGDTTTRLADKVMTEAAKGRGFSLPWQISDSKSPYGRSRFYSG
jgi:cytoplasmic tRNA 2-thiolation protein 2